MIIKSHFHTDMGIGISRYSATGSAIGLKTFLLCLEKNIKCSYQNVSMIIYNHRMD